jgi:hypothetical protein|tara:strand:- start:2353 stop:2646 length:294 start_codon:yes stop_codon:yes gene_type:complete
MSTYPVDIKAKRIQSTVANQEVFAGPGRFLGFSANCTAGAGTITLEDNGVALAVFGTPNGSSSPFVYNATFPGTGIKANTKLTVSLGTIADVTFYFG